MEEVDPNQDTVAIPITGELDLHTFSPSEATRVIDAYLDACAHRGIYSIRIVHGKGIGTLRRMVLAHLSRHPAVAELKAADEMSGGWGAVWVALRR